MISNNSNKGARVGGGRCGEGGRVADCSIQFFVPFFSKLTKVKKRGLFFEFTVHSSLSDTLILNFGAKITVPSHQIEYSRVWYKRSDSLIFGYFSMPMYKRE